MFELGELDSLNESEVLHLLKERFSKDYIYVSIFRLSAVKRLYIFKISKYFSDKSLQINDCNQPV